MKPLYQTQARASGGRHGRVQSDNPPLSLELAMPQSLGGAGGNATNPEQLFAAGYAACFESALRLVARQKKLALSEVAIRAVVTLGQDEGGFRLAVSLIGEIGGVDRTEAQALMAAAHEVCPYSKATRGNIEVTLSVA